MKKLPTDNVNQNHESLADVMAAVRAYMDKEAHKIDTKCGTDRINDWKMKARESAQVTATHGPSSWKNTI